MAIFTFTAGITNPQRQRIANAFAAHGGLSPSATNAEKLQFLARELDEYARHIVRLEERRAAATAATDPVDADVNSDLGGL